MPDVLPKDLQRFVDHELASGRYESTDALVIAGLRLLQRDRQEAVEGIQEGLAEKDRAEGVPLDEAFDEIRRGLQIPRT